MTTTRNWTGRVTPVVAAALGLLLVVPQTAAAVQNPILGDGTYYSADPAPLVVDDTLYVFAGRDEAGVTQNDFIMNEWQAFSTTDVSADVESDAWEHHPAPMRPEQVFDWASRAGPMPVRWSRVPTAGSTGTCRCMRPRAPPPTSSASG